MCSPRAVNPKGWAGESMANYLATGAAGFIASKVAELLAAEGHQITYIDNLNGAYDPLPQTLAAGGFRFCQANIRDRQSLENPLIYFETNTRDTLNLLEMCRHCGVPKLVLASTSSLYGSRNPVPYSEQADTNHPLSPYAASKKAAETLCHNYHHLYGINVTVVRYFTVYGLAGRSDMSLFRFVQWVSEQRPVVVYGDGTQSRDFTYVDDIARGTITCRAFPPTAPGKPFKRRQGDDLLISPIQFSWLARRK